MVVFTDCHPGRDDEFNEWYSGTHVPDVLDLDGFVAVQRFRAADPAAGAGRYLAVWEIEGDLERARRALAEGPPRPHSSAYDRSATVVRFYTALGERVS